MIAGYYRSLI